MWWVTAPKSEYWLLLGVDTQDITPRRQPLSLREHPQRGCSLLLGLARIRNPLGVARGLAPLRGKLGRQRPRKAKQLALRPARPRTPLESSPARCKRFFLGTKSHVRNAHPQRLAQRTLEYCTLKVEDARHRRRPAPHGKGAAGEDRLAHLVGCDSALEAGTDLPGEIVIIPNSPRGKEGEARGERRTDGCKRHGYDFLMGMSTYRKLGSPRGFNTAGLAVVVAESSSSSVVMASTPSRR